MTNAAKTPEHGIDLSDGLLDASRDNPDASGRRRIGVVQEALTRAVRAALDLALVTGGRVTVVLAGDPTRGVPERAIEGTVSQFDTAPNGRERVRIIITDDAEQVILLEKIVRVALGR